MNHHETLLDASDKENLMCNLKPTLFAVTVAATTLAPAAAANAGVLLSNHNETLLLDA